MRGRLLVCTAAAAALLTAGCSQQATMRAVPAGVHSGGRLVVGILAPHTVAPWLTSTLDPYGSLIVQTMCDQVLALDPATSGLTPSIASGWRYQTPNDMILKLRKGLMFPDGSKVSAADIADSVSRAARSEIGSPVADVLKPIVGWNVLQGLPTAKKQKEKYRQRLEGVAVPDRSSLEIVLAFRSPDAFRFLTHPITSVVPSKAFNRDPSAMERRPTCVGPYSLTAPWEPGAASITLARSRHYVATNHAYTGGGAGFFDTIQFRVLPNAAALTRAYAAHQLDVAFLPDGPVGSGLPASDVVTAGTPTLHYLGLPTTRPPFDSGVVRAALSLATDRGAVAAAAPGRLRPESRFLPPTLGPAYTARSTCRFTAPEHGSVAVAKSLLAHTHLSLAGQSVRVLYNDEFDNKRIVTAATRLWPQLGLRVVLVPTPWSDLTDRASKPSGLNDAFRFSWRPETDDPVAFVRPLFHSTEIGKSNWSRFALSPFDQRIDKKAEHELDDERRAQLMTDAEAMLCGAMPMIPLAEGQAAYAVRRDAVSSAADRFTDLASGALLLRELYAKQ